ncbi:cell division protein FtsA [Marinitoga hydrogenitolerans DSM 16785]|uniref:Cell division protein FtsA n=1 Tax=Marinitoga hydrogenitolerans (strain DSM 16785 / JCM 12826 / AT1271) TaxID=1122195 RepID=A0A1M4U8Q4_MARH1|nr:cell division FtsA domain-containing protein [Marinitoga hydrogenitolerans]SHE53095.1 cell division protein FtsA [Marinitoga hydrogenitolerans DSM 16785]
MAKKVIYAIDVGNFFIKGIALEEVKGRFQMISKSIERAEGIVKGQVQDVKALRRKIENVIYTLEGENNKAKEIEIILSYATNELKISRESYTLEFSEPKEITEGDLEKIKSNIQQKYSELNKEVLDIKFVNFEVDDKKVKNPVAFVANYSLNAVINVIWVPENAFAPIRNTIKNLVEGEIPIYDSTLAAAYGVTNTSDRNLGVGIIDLGHSKARMLIFKDGIPKFYLDFEVGMEYVLKDLMHVLKTSEGEALRLLEEQAVCLQDTKVVKKVDYLSLVGDHYEYTTQNLLNKIVFARTREIINKLNSDLAKLEYENTLEIAGGLQAGIVHTGGGARIKNIEKTISDFMGSQTRLGVASNNSSNFYIENADELFKDPLFSPILGTINLYFSGTNIPKLYIEDSKDYVENNFHEEKVEKKGGFFSRLGRILLGGNEDAI